jgi:serine/tyrosine/threonine adenylyltransferase
MKPQITAFEKTFESAAGRAFSFVNPAPLLNVSIAAVSEPVAVLLGLSKTDFLSADAALYWSGSAATYMPKPIAHAYSGHQFGQWAGQLGDGRAMTIGSLNGYEIQFKGAGLTPYSRMGDGRAVLRSSVREYLCSEAMAGLRIATTRALCLTSSSSVVIRENVEKGAVVTRVAPSFIRFGHFEHFYYHQEPELLQQLCDFVIDHFYPSARQHENPAQEMLRLVVERTADLMVQWQAVGFCHGVMNTDNMSILGLTIDYGPFGFLDAYDPKHICNHSDGQGRYSYQNQPSIGQWNCFALGQALVSIIGSPELTKQALAEYAPRFESEMKALWHKKIGLAIHHDDDGLLIDQLFEIMQSNRVDFTLMFRALANIQIQSVEADHQVFDLFIDRQAAIDWLARYRTRLLLETRSEPDRQHSMNQVNPRYILRNHLAQSAIQAAESGDFSEIDRLLAVLRRPFDEQPENAHYAQLPPDWASTLEVSCSS